MESTAAQLASIQNFSRVQRSNGLWRYGKQAHFPQPHSPDYDDGCQWLRRTGRSAGQTESMWDAERNANHDATRRMQGRLSMSEPLKRLRQATDLITVDGSFPPRARVGALCANMSETSRPSTITVGRGKKSHFDEHRARQVLLPLRWQLRSVAEKLPTQRAPSCRPPGRWFPILKWSLVRIVVVSAPSISCR